MQQEKEWPILKQLSVDRENIEKIEFDRKQAEEIREHNEREEMLRSSSSGDDQAGAGAGVAGLTPVPITEAGAGKGAKSTAKQPTPATKPGNKGVGNTRNNSSELTNSSVMQDALAAIKENNYIFSPPDYASVHEIPLVLLCGYGVIESGRVLLPTDTTPVGGEYVLEVTDGVLPSSYRVIKETTSNTIAGTRRKTSLLNNKRGSVQSLLMKSEESIDSIDKRESISSVDIQPPVGGGTDGDSIGTTNNHVIKVTMDGYQAAKALESMNEMSKMVKNVPVNRQLLFVSIPAIKEAVVE